MNYVFLNIGKKTCNDQKYLKEQYCKLDWEILTQDKKLPMSQGLVIKEFIREFKIPYPSHVAVHGNINTLGFYGVRAKYSNGVFDICFVDSGIEIIPILIVQIKKE